MPIARAAVLTALVLSTSAVASAGPVDLPRFPALSPDGSRLLFSWRGDVWTVGIEGGAARRLTVHPADDLEARWSPDGTRIAFASDRSGVKNIWLMTADGGDIRPLTDLDRPCNLSGFGTDADGRPVVLFDSTVEGDVYREPRPFMVGLDGGPARRVHDAFGSEPLTSADGALVVFTRGGYYDGWERRHYRGAEAADVWLHDRRDGSFRQLTHWNGNDGRTRWGGPDGRSLVFMSDREDRTVHLFRMAVADGDATIARLTPELPHDVRDFDVSADGSTAVLMVWEALHVLRLDDPAAELRRIEISAPDDASDDFRYRDIARDVSAAALSPDGKVMAMIAYGDVYVRAVAEDSPTRRVTRDEARAIDLAWSPDGLKLYFTTDRSGEWSIDAAVVERTRGEVKEALEPKKDDAEPEAEPAAPAEPEADDGQPAAPAEEAPADAPADAPKKDEKKDDKKKELPPELRPERWQDALTFVVTPVVERGIGAPSRAPNPSPDGTKLAFRGVRGDMHVLDLASDAITTVREHWDADTEWVWSPDGQWVAYATSDLDFNNDIFIMPADGSAPPVNVTRHPDNDGSPRWSADGRILAFLSERVDEQVDVFMVHLDRDLDAMTEADLKKYHDDAAEAAKKRKPLAVKDPNAADDEGKDEGKEAKADDAATPAFDQSDLADAYLRVRRMTSHPGDEGNLALTPGGDRLIFSRANPDGGLVSIRWDRKEEKSLGSFASVQGVSLTGDAVVLIAGGQAATVKPTGGERTAVGIADRVRIDLAAQASQKFMEAARGLGEGFYHPMMNGTDWPALSAQYHDLAVRTRTAEEFNWVANRFIGELNGSHLAVRMPGEPNPNVEGHARLGIDAVPIEGGGYRVTRVLPRSVASDGPMALREGDEIVAVAFEPLGPLDTLEERLKGLAGKETAITVRRADDAGEAREVVLLIEPVSAGAERGMRYLDWRLENARRVEARSGGRLGYIHIQSMDQPSLDVFERDLFAAAYGKEGLVLDVRNNGGGWTTDRLLASIMYPAHASTVPRGADWSERGHYPQDRLFIQRYGMPMNLLCNEKSYSNAEIISHAFKTLKRGTLVGQQTHGSVISTGGWSLIDGTFVRLPFRGWFIEDGTGRDMELNGALPDLLVPQLPDAEAAGRDDQLDAAVDDLLQRLP